MGEKYLVPYNFPNELGRVQIEPNCFVCHDHATAHLAGTIECGLAEVETASSSLTVV